jgi:hypothetical protein
MDTDTDTIKADTRAVTLRVVRGNPAPEELAAVTVVLLALSGAADRGTGPTAPSRGPAGPHRAGWDRTPAVPHLPPRGWTGG